MCDVPVWSDLIGTPFQPNGRGPEAFDCLGLVAEMKRREGRPIPALSTPPGDDSMALLLASQIPLCDELPGPRPGAIVAMRIGRLVRHVGYMVSDYEMVHAWERSGGVIKEPIANWRRQIVGFYEYAQ